MMLLTFFDANHILLQRDRLSNSDLKLGDVPPRVRVAFGTEAPSASISLIRIDFGTGAANFTSLLSAWPGLEVDTEAARQEWDEEEEESCREEDTRRRRMRIEKQPEVAVAEQLVAFHDNPHCGEAMANGKEIPSLAR